MLLLPAKFAICEVVASARPCIVIAWGMAIEDDVPSNSIRPVEVPPLTVTVMLPVPPAGPRALLFANRNAPASIVVIRAPVLPVLLLPLKVHVPVPVFQMLKPLCEEEWGMSCPESTPFELPRKTISLALVVPATLVTLPVISKVSASDWKMANWPFWSMEMCATERVVTA